MFVLFYWDFPKALHTFASFLTSSNRKLSSSRERTPSLHRPAFPDQPAVCHCPTCCSTINDHLIDTGTDWLVPVSSYNIFGPIAYQNWTLKWGTKRPCRRIPQQFVAQIRESTTQRSIHPASRILLSASWLSKVVQLNRHSEPRAGTKLNQAHVETESWIHQRHQQNQDANREI
jgi:hypothetical protein